MPKNITANEYSILLKNPTEAKKALKALIKASNIEPNEKIRIVRDVITQSANFSDKDLLEFVIAVAALPNALPDAIHALFAAFPANNLNFNQKETRQNFLKLIQTLSHKKPINLSVIINLLTSTNSQPTLQQALLSNKDKDGLKEFMQILKELMQAADNEEHVQKIFLLITGQNLQLKTLEVDSSDSENSSTTDDSSSFASAEEILPTYQEQAPSIYSQTLGDKKIQLILEECISIALEKGLATKLVFDLFTSTYALLNKVVNTFRNTQENIKDLMSQFNLLNILFEKNIIDIDVYREKQLANFIVKVIKSVGLKDNDHALIVQRLMKNLLSLLPEQDVRDVLSEILNSPMNKEDKSRFVLLALQTNLVADALAEVLIQNSTQLDISYLLMNKKSVKKSKNADLLEAIIIKSSIDRYLEAFPTFEIQTQTLQQLIYLKQKASAQNIFFVLKNINLLQLHNIFYGHMGEFLLTWDPGLIYLDLLMTLDNGNIRPADILSLMLTTLIYDIDETQAVPLVSLTNKKTLQKYVAFMISLWDKYNVQGVSLEYGHKRPSVSEITRLFSAQYYYRSNRSTASLLQHILINKDKESFTLLANALMQNISRATSDNQGDSEHIFDLLTRSLVNKINPAFAQYQVNAVNCPYVLASVDPSLSEDLMKVLKNMLTKGSLSEPGVKVLKFLKGLTEHLTSIKNPKDKSLLRLVDNNFQLLEICLQKGTITVADCLEIIFATSKNTKHATLLDFAAEKNVEVLAKIFQFLQKIQLHGVFNIEPYVQQVLSSTNVSKKQKANFEKLYKSYFSQNTTEQLAAKLMPSSALTKPQKTAFLLNLIQAHQLGPEHEAVLKQFHDQVDKETIFTKMHQVPQEQHTVEYQRTLSMLIRALPQENHSLHWGHLIRENHHADIAAAHPVDTGAGVEHLDNVGAPSHGSHMHA